MSTASAATSSDTLAAYREYLQNKVSKFKASGFEVDDLSPYLFDFQRHCVKTALLKGRYALFQDCGLGKTLQQLEWSRKVVDHTKQPVLIVAPLAVSGQTIQEGIKFGIHVERYKGQENAGIYITNYEQLGNIDCSLFSGVVLDESSILKNFDGKTRDLIIERFRETPYKLACTATPSPNDQMELGNHAEFLNVMSRNEMLAMYFVHDGGETAKWRLKGHATADFWAWVASWSVMMATPADLGFSAQGYDLPELRFIEKKIVTPKKDNGMLFNDTAVSATHFNQELRLTKVDRLEEVAKIVNASDEPFILWVKQNEEADYLKALVPDAVEVRGSDSIEHKEAAISWFLGDTCRCKLSPKYAKLSDLWPIRNSPINSDTISKTASENLPLLSSGGGTTQNIESNTCANTTPQIKTSGRNGVSRKTTKGTLSGASGTETTNPSVRKRSSKLKNTETPILSAIIGNVLRQTTESQSNNTTNYSPNKTEDALSAAENLRSSRLSSDYTLITATAPETCEGSSALIATTDSENSKTAPNSSNRQFHTCGHAVEPHRVFVSKASMFGYGLNFQHCHNQVFASLDFSFEGLYQAIRRSYRFGQEYPVNIYLITTDTMQNVVEAIERKEKQFKEMQEQMIKASNEVKVVAGYVGKHSELLNEHAHIRKGDCVELIRDVPSESVGFSIFSPPFASLYTYSDKVEDMGNCSDYDAFEYAFSSLAQELFRVMWQGRNVAVHCMDLPIQKGKEGYIGLRDFSGLIRSVFEQSGFIYHSRVTIWKDPVTEMQRTKALGLLHKQVKKDASMSRVGIPDYLLVFRKPGEHAHPVKCDIPVDVWQQYASPVWLDIDYGKTLNVQEARESNDERHICPLQLQTIERCIHLWSNEGDTVLTPFMGIGSEVFQAVKMNRKGIGFELKDSYFDVAVKNVQAAIDGKKQMTIFEVVDQ